SATFKLAPLPKASKTLRLNAGTAAAVARIVTAIMTSQLEPIAFEIAAGREGRSFHVLLRFASLPAGVDEQIAQPGAAPHAAAEAALKECADGAAILTGDDEESAWREHTNRVWSEDAAAVARASWLPAHIEPMLAALDECGAGVELTLVGRAAVGVGLIRIA